MNDFFNTNTTNTYSIRTTKGDYTFTAQDIAKIAAFGERYIAWDGAETWIASAAVADMVAIFCTEEGEERGKLREELCGKVDSYSYNANDEFRVIVNEARDILTQWGSLKLYTTLRKNEDGESKFIHPDRLEAALGIDLGDTVRERLSHVQVFKDTDGDWIFDSATGRSYRETATIGILTEIRDAVQFFPTMLKHCIAVAKEGHNTLEKIAEASYSIDLDRWPNSDVDDMVAALSNEDLTPDRYSVYYTKHNEFGMGISNEVADRWDFVEVINEFTTKQEAADFRSAANKNFSIEKKRQRLMKVITDTEQQLADLREEYLTLLD